MEEIEHLHDALIDAVKACGGSKKVAAMLWPAKASQNLEGARRSLANCLNPECAEKLSLEEIMLILGAARKRGNHTVIEFLCDALNYSRPTPVEPEDERAKLKREYIEAARSMAKLAERIELAAGQVAA